MGVTMATAYLAPVHPLRSGPLPPPPHPPPSLGSQTRRGRPRSRLRLPHLRGPGLWSSALKPSANKARNLASAKPAAGHRRSLECSSLYLYTRLLVFTRSVDAVSGHALEVVFFVAVVFIVILTAVQKGDLIEHRATQTLFGALLTRVPTNAMLYGIIINVNMQRSVGGGLTTQIPCMCKQRYSCWHV